MKFRLGWDRFIQRVAMTDILPQEIQWRTSKAHLIPLLKKNLFSSKKKHLEKMIYERNGILEEYVDLDTIKNIFHNYQCENIIAYNHAYHIWSAILLYIWLEKFICHERKGK